MQGVAPHGRYNLVNLRAAVVRKLYGNRVVDTHFVLGGLIGYDLRRPYHTV